MARKRELVRLRAPDTFTINSNDLELRSYGALAFKERSIVIDRKFASKWLEAGWAKADPNPKEDEGPLIRLKTPDGRKIIWVDWGVAPAMLSSGWQEIRPVPPRDSLQGGAATTPTWPDQDKRYRFIRRAERRIRAFDDYHYMRGKWISFRRLVEWGASHDERPNYHLLSKAVTGGEFERGGRSLILFMSLAALQAGLLRFSCAEAVKPRDIWEAAYLSHFWIPRRVCWEWFVKEDYEMPPWLEQHNLPSPPPWIDALAQSLAPQAKMVAITSSGRGAMERAIKAAYHELFPQGIPPGTSSQQRDDKISEAVKLVAGRKPDTRTIQRALKRLSG